MGVNFMENMISEYNDLYSQGNHYMLLKALVTHTGVNVVEQIFLHLRPYFFT